MKKIDKLTDIIDQYEAIVCDAWGVIHNGIIAHSSALNALTFSVNKCKPVVIITNAPRLENDLILNFGNMGIKHGSYNKIISSGQLGREIALAKNKKNIFFLGPETDLSLLSNSNLVQTRDLDQVELIINAGLRNNKVETPDIYFPLLHSLADRNLEMICLNPDQIVHIGNDVRYCAGALANYYQDIGGCVNWVGKPEMLIYDKSLQYIDDMIGRKVNRNKILAIGDSIATDMLGGIRNGLATLFVCNGVHQDDFLDCKSSDFYAQRIYNLCEKYSILPDFYICNLK